MSTSSQAAATAVTKDQTADTGASLQQGKGQGKGDKKVVQFPPQSGSINLMRQPLQRDAHRHYEAEGTLFRGSLPIRCYVERRKLGLLASALGRQITKEELSLFIGVEAVGAECAITKKPFQPVWWAVITQHLIDLAARDKEIMRDRIVKVGCFFMSPDPESDQVLTFSGYPYSWKRGRFSEESDRLADENPLIFAYRESEFRWGFTLDRVNETVASRKSARKREQEAEVRLVQVKEFFTKKPKDKRRS
ncbi:MAG TPA: hypothetical protein VGE35_03250 [Candidatus Paceibacterota bacterium]